MIERGETPLFPFNPAPYLIDWLFDVGPTIPSSMGEGIVEYRDLLAWQNISGIELLPWEAALLKRLSRSYLAMSQQAKEPFCPIPYSGEVEDVVSNRDRVVQQIKATFANLKKAN